MVARPGFARFWPLPLAVVAGVGALTHVTFGQGFPPAAIPAEQPLSALPGVAAAAMQSPPVAGQAPEPRQLVVDVEITGNEGAKDYEIQKHIQTRPDREFDPELVQADVRRIMQTGKYRDVKTFTRQAPSGVIVVFEVFERPRINYIRHLGNRSLGEKKLMTEHGMKVGDPLSSYTSEEGRRKLEELYHREGLPNATVTLLEGDRKEDKGVIFVINEGQLERIAWVTFQGNTIASDSRLKTQIESKPGYFWYLFGGKVDRQKIEADVEKLTIYYRGLGFMQARVGRELDFDESGKWLTLRFIIDEGPRFRVRNITVEGNSKFANRPLLEMMKLRSGEYFNQSYMNRDLTLITELYGSQGHVFADVQADPRFLEEPGQMDIVYRVKEGDVFKVGEINVNIAGEFPHTRQTVVLNRMSLRPGDIIDTREVQSSERRMKASQLFNTDPQQGDPPRVAIRPPEFDALGDRSRPKPTIRGQSPEGPTAMPPPSAGYPPPWPRAQSSPPLPPAGVSPSLRTGTDRFSWEGPRQP
ncbi:MAG: POTRA domain-containing protein [Pirellulaceae bacterium]|nr:POTRA domain-containing protein [Pirellulaceae bacterium]